MTLEWKEIVRELERAATQEAIPAVMVDLADRWEREASTRIRRALVDGMGARMRYDLDPKFHMAIDALALLAAHAIFDAPLVTDAERDARREGFRTIFEEDWHETSRGAAAEIQTQ